MKRAKKPSPIEKEQENSFFLPLFTAPGEPLPSQFTSLGFEKPQEPRKSLLKPEDLDD